MKCFLNTAFCATRLPPAGWSFRETDTELRTEVQDKAIVRPYETRARSSVRYASTRAARPDPHKRTCICLSGPPTMDNSTRADVLSNELLNGVAEMVDWTREVDVRLAEIAQTPKRRDALQ